MGELDATVPGWRVHDVIAARKAIEPPWNNNANKQAKLLAGRIPARYTLDDKDPAYVRDESLEGWAREWRREDARTLPTQSTLEWHESNWPKVEFLHPAALNLRFCSAGDHTAIPTSYPEYTARRAELDDLEKVEWLLEYFANLHAIRGESDLACDAVLALQAVLAAMGEEPSELAQSLRRHKALGMGERLSKILGFGEPSDAKLAECIDACLREAEAPRLRQQILGDAAFQLERHEARLDPSLFLFRKDVLDSQIAELSDAVRALPFIHMPPGVERTRTIATLKPGPWRGGVLKADVEECEAVASLRCSAVGLACERYRLHFGQFPDSLLDIPSFLLPVQVLDPFSDQPLQYSFLPDGIVIRSVHSSDLAHPWDSSFLLYLPEARRRPAVEKPE